MIQDLFRFRETLTQEGIYLCFTGPLSQSLMEDIVGNLRRKMKSEGVNLSIIMNTFSIAVELIQNMIRYSAETVPADQEPAEFRQGILIVGHEENHYFVLSGNLIKNTQVPALQDRLMTLSSMTQEELKQHFKEERKKPMNPDTSGAGLGFIEVARKARQPLEFSFQPVDEQVSFFSFKTII